MSVVRIIIIINIINKIQTTIMKIITLIYQQFISLLKIHTIDASEYQNNKSEYSDLFIPLLGDEIFFDSKEETKNSNKERKKMKERATSLRF